MSTFTDEEILKLWKDKTFIGSFRGISTFQMLLKLEFDFDISRYRLQKILKEEPLYVMHQRPIRQIIRRPFDCRAIGELLNADLSSMFSYNGFKYFLLIVDVYSCRLFAKALRTKSAKSVENGFDEFLKIFPTNPHVLETDRGSEFISQKTYFKEHHIVWKPKFGKHKANRSEYYNFLVKQRVYKILQNDPLQKNWPEILKKVIEQYNNTPLKKLGGLTPNSIESEYDSILVEDRLKSLQKKVYKEPNFHEQQKNQTMYEKNEGKIQVGDLVYASKEEKLFDKSFTVQRGEVFVVRKIDATIKPVLYYLSDLMNTPVPGSFYEEQLFLSPKTQPTDSDLFKVEKVIYTRTFKGKKFHFVKFINYPDKFNKYLSTKELRKRP